MSKEKKEVFDVVKGFRDYAGKDALKREKIRGVLMNAFRSYGYEPAETPIIELEKFVRGNNSDDEAVSDIFTLKDKAERSLALRYELTFQLKRLTEGKKLPYKRLQIGPVFRNEPVKGNRWRQFTQCDVDVVGSTLKDEAEILAITSQILKELKIDATIFFNSRKLLNEILDDFGVKESDKEKVIREIDKLDKLPESEVKNNLKKYKVEDVVSVFKNKESYFKKYKSYSEINELKGYCKLYGIDIVFLPSLARGLSYYNGSVFEVKTSKEGVKETITAGGSYLVNGIQATGISFGLERLSLLAEIDIDFIDFIIVSLDQDGEAVKLAQMLRKAGKSCTIFYGKPSKALEYANSYGIQKAIFVGAEEVKRKKFKLKNLNTGKERFFSKKNLVEV